MDITTKIFRLGGGKLKGRWRLRIRYRDDVTGKWIDAVQKSYKTRAEAIDARPAEEARVRTTEGKIVTGDKMTFSDLVAHAKATFYRPAVIREGRKIAGIKSHRQTYVLIKTLENYFGDRRIGSIRKADLEDYKVMRTESVTLATINRELATMRKMLNEALTEGWVTHNPFQGSHLIEIAAEDERKRKLTIEEEAKLIHFAHGEFETTYKRKIRGVEREVPFTAKHDAPYLRAAILLAIESAMRKSEILKLDWKDIDLEKRLIRVLGTNTKTQRERLVPLRQRAFAELLKLESYKTGGKVFPVKDLRRAFDTTKRLAGIKDLRFHDLRTHAITTMQTKGIPLGVAGQIAGHTQISTTNRYYTTTDEEILTSARHTMDAAEIQTTSEAIN